MVSLQQVHGMSSRYTFIPNKTYIDHILVGKRETIRYTLFNILNESDVITSDHLPIISSLSNAESNAQT